MIRYKVRVINAPDGLIIRSGKGQTFNRVGKLSNGTDHIIVERSTLSNGQIWDKLEDGRGYICHKFDGGIYYTKTIEDLTGNKPKPNDNSMQTPKDKGGTNQNGTSGDTKAPPLNTGHQTGLDYNIPTEDETELITEQELLEQASQVRGYPTYSHTDPISGTKVYDWTIDYSDFEKNFDTIKRNNNITSIYDRNTLMTKMFQNFNRFKVEYPDYHMTKTIPVVFITRPQLNILDDTGNRLHEQVVDDPKMHYIFQEEPNIVKSLTSSFSKNHDFNVLLSSNANSLEVMDEVLDTLETGETFSGYKIQYAKHNIKSITAGTMSIKYTDGKYLPITKMHQVWVDYMNQVYRGLLLPTKDNIYNKVIDYACSIYYFLLDSDGETIVFWSKYYGVFPLNVPKSVLSYDKGSDISFPDVTVNYAYFYKEDLSPMALVEFNENSGGTTAGFKYREIYEPKLGTIGKTWVGSPFIESFSNSSGKGFKLRYRHN